MKTFISEMGISGGRLGWGDQWHARMLLMRDVWQHKGGLLGERDMHIAGWRRLLWRLVRRLEVQLRAPRCSHRGWRAWAGVGVRVGVGQLMRRRDPGMARVDWGGGEAGGCGHATRS
jgi:hypothetical protein